MLQRPAGSQQRLIRLDRRPGLRAAELGSRLRKHRQAEPVQRRREPLAIAHLAGDDQWALGALQRGGKRGDLARRGQDATSADYLPRHADRHRHLAWCRDKWFAKREVQMDGSVRRFGKRARRQAPPEPRRIGQLDRRSGVEEPSHRGAVEPLLVDRLVGAGALQLRWPVGGDDDERRA